MGLAHYAMREWAEPAHTTASGPNEWGKQELHLLRQALDRLPGDYIVERCARFNISRVGVGGTMRVATCVSGCNANRSWAFSDPFVLNRVLRPDQFGRDPDPDHNPDGAACANLKLAGDDKGLLCPAHLKCVAECFAGQSMCAGRDCPAPPSTWLAAETALNATCTSRNEACAGECNDARLSCGALAQQVGKLSLTLRGLGEVTEGALQPITTDQLSDYTAPEEAQEFKVRVRRGGSVTNETIGEVTPSGTTPVEQTPAEN